MPIPPCQVEKSYPDPDALSAITVKTKAIPCPISVGHQSIHTIELENQRPNSIYSIEFLTKSLFNKIELNGTNEWLHSESVIPIGLYQKNHPMIAQSTSQNSSDEILCTLELYDATQRSDNNSFSGKKEKTTLIYSINIQ